MRKRDYRDITKLTIEKVDLICKMFLEDASINEIYEATGISKASLNIYRAFLAWHGKEVFVDHYINGKKPHYTTDELNSIVECMVANGLSYQATSVMFRIHKEPLVLRLKYKQKNVPLGGASPAPMPNQTNSEYSKLNFRIYKSKQREYSIKKTLTKPDYEVGPYKAPEQVESKQQFIEGYHAVKEPAVINITPEDVKPSTPKPKAEPVEVDSRGYDANNVFRGRATAPVVHHKGKWRDRSKANIKASKLNEAREAELEQAKAQAEGQISTQSKESRELVDAASKAARKIKLESLPQLAFVAQEGIDAKDYSPERKRGRPKKINVFSDGFAALPDSVKIQALTDTVYSLVGQLQATILAYEFELGNNLIQYENDGEPSNTCLKKKLPNISKKSKFIALQIMTNTYTNYSESQLCRFLGLTDDDKDYRKNKQKERNKTDDKAELKEAILQVFIDKGQGKWGYRKITKYLRESLDPPFSVNSHTVSKYMKELKLQAYPANKVRKSNSYQGESPNAVDNLLERSFNVQTPYTVILTDVSEEVMLIGEQRLKFFYIPFFDLCTKKFLSFLVHCNSNVQTVCRALKEAINNMPEADGTLRILHSDRGYQYHHDRFVELCEQAGITRSMSAKGSCPDNGAMESQFSTFKRAVIEGRRYKSQVEFISAVEEYVIAFNQGQIPKVEMKYSDRLERPTISNLDTVKTLKEKHIAYRKKKKMLSKLSVSKDKDNPNSTK